MKKSTRITHKTLEDIIWSLMPNTTAEDIEEITGINFIGIYHIVNRRANEALHQHKK